jgi:hypothetical protein
MKKTATPPPTCPFSGVSLTEVRVVNENDRCPKRTKAATRLSTKPVCELSEAEKKQEYYFLLLQHLPIIVGSYLKPLKGQEHHPSMMTPVVDANTFLDSSYWLHHAIGLLVCKSVELWAQKQNWQDPEMKRLLDLTDEKRKNEHGTKAAEKRIASAMLQTLHISASLERFTFNLFVKKHDRQPSPEEIALLHSGNLKSAMALTELHLERTREVRPVLGADALEGGIIGRYIDDSGFILTEERVELAEGVLSEKMLDRPIDTKDGRIGCPGAIHVPFLWEWIIESSQKSSYQKLA